jgi:hypothetical protein
MSERASTYNPLLLVPKDPQPDEWKETLQRLLGRPSGLTTLPTAESKSSGTESAESSKSEATSQETAKEEHR